MSKQEYIHTFSKDEQDRLLRQGEFLEPYIHQKIDFTDCRIILEIGCGVGAQISVLSRKFPYLKIVGIDSSDKQIERANIVLHSLIKREKVTLKVASAYELPFPDNCFDGICIFFVLEHTNEPLTVLHEAHRVLKSGGVLYCTEVFNSGFYVYPKCPAISEYWAAFNKYQADIGGDPDIGIKLVNLALESGFGEISYHDASAMLDRRMSLISQRSEFLNFWKSLFFSASESITAQGRASSTVVSEIHEEFEHLIENKDAVFVYSGKQIKCYK